MSESGRVRSARRFHFLHTWESLTCNPMTKHGRWTRRRCTECGKVREGFV